MTSPNVVLIVDDEAAHRKLITRAITKLNQLKKIEVGSLEEARTYLLTHHSELIAVILDLNLGSESGLSLLKEIRKNPETASMNVIMVSTSLLEEDVKQSYQAGANCIVHKSAVTSEFQSNLQKALTFFCRLP